MSQIDIDKMKVTELKAECKKRGLPVSGNKSVLINNTNFYKDFFNGDIDYITQSFRWLLDNRKLN